ncbi:hypothetical protein QN277_010518 [Acacia crassicarpa]|uniref:Disease resistance protein At4g27190-like leucine-rich repeats domain-containing protein n=2 Tax=Acacia crassicarpa TaxID=499986 RepID=A0AAE1MBS1_9FABA|nr:hypothetical protein QN277_010518 [Acacia crassicarpa]
MGCQAIQLQILTNEEALNLFKAHASLNDSSRGFMGMPQKIVKHCGGVPVAIVALARALKHKPISVWKDALKTLEGGGLDRNLEEAYKCLKLSYDNLKSQKAKDLLLISSLFPEDSEIPIKLLIKTGIGLGSFNENDKYHLIRSEVEEAIEELIHSSLLLNDKEQCVKMHDLVREVALWIGENDIQSLLDLEKPIKGNFRYIFWKSDKFPDEIVGNKLEYLSIFLHDSKGFNITDTFFKEMTNIKVLTFDDDGRGPALSLTNSLQPLKSIQTLILSSMELGDISVLGNLLTLMTLWFYDCSIIELPKEFLKLKSLRSLEVEECKIERNNPFEVIEMCSQLEELSFAGNECDDEEKDAISHNGSPLTLHRYCISSQDDLSYYSEKYGLSRCFRADKLSNLVSHATFEQLVERAEVLSLERGDKKRIWKNLVPDIVPIDKQGVMNDLVVLHLSSHPNMEYLIDIKDHDPSMSAFCNLAELHLSEMGVEDLCRGPPPSGFLEQLEILKLTECYKLENILFNAHYNLCHLKSMELENCPKLMSVFQPYTARSLIQLKKLTIKDCSALEYIIAAEDDDSNQKSYYDSLFPSLKELKLSIVPSFIGIVREYHQLKSSLMHKQSPSLSRHNSRNLNQSLTTRAFSWVQACCSLNKLRPASKDRSLDPTNPLKFDASRERGSPSLTAQSLLLQSLKNIRQITLWECHNVISLSTLSIAASTIALETLTVLECHKLKCITTHEGDAQVDGNNCSIFPTLKKLEIKDCEALEFIFVSAISVGLQKLKSLTIVKVPKLKCVFGNYQKEEHSSNQNHDDELHFDLPTLETLFISYAPKISIFAKNYSMANWIATEEVHASTIGAPLFHVTQNLLKNIRKIELVGCTNLILLTTLSTASIILLEVLTVRACDQLKCIVGDEGDARTQIDYNSIFPKLKQLEVSYCNALEYLFPAYAFRSPVYLKSLKISRAPMLKFVFGRSQYDDSLNLKNQNIQTLIDFPALKDLSIEYVPKLLSIYPENYYMRGLYLRFVILKELPEFTIRHFSEFLVCWHTEQQETKVIEMCRTSLESLQVCGFKIEEIFDLTYKETEKKGDELQPLTSSLQELSLLYLSELVNICVGPKCIIWFDSLRVLTIKACKNLRIIFSASIVRSLPVLKDLCISECEELVHIVEEDYKTNADDHVRHEPCFPNLRRVSVSDCEKLKYLFSITISDILPKLLSLYIHNAYELEHVLIKRDEMEEIVMKDVFPQQCRLQLINLPNLISVCHRINFQKGDYFTAVYNCPKFDTSTTQHQADLETGNSQVEEKVEETLSSHMVVQGRAKGVSSNPLYQISLTSEKEVPIHTSLSLTVIPTIDNTHACAKIFEEEEEEQGCLITSRRLQSGIKASSSLLEDKLETSINGVDHGNIKEAGMVQSGYKLNVEPSSLTRREQESSYSKGQIQTKDQLTDSQSRNAKPTTPFVTISQNEHSEIVEVRGEEGALILETPHPSSLASKEDEMAGKVARNERIIIDPQQSTMGTQKFTKDELVGKEVQKETTMMEAQSEQETTGHDIHFHKEEEEREEREDDVQLPNKSQSLAIDSSRSGNLVPKITHPINSLEGVNNKGINEAGVVQNESKTKLTCHGDQANPSNITQIEQETSHSRGRMVESHDCIESDFIEKTKLSVSPLYTPIEMMPSFLETTNEASIVTGLQEIIHMMKLEGFESLIFAKALMTRPQLQLCTKDRSARMLCMSYRVLLDILNILTTKTPFTITEADKTLLSEHLKDAYLLGFDKDWIESIKTKVFDSGIYEVDRIQKVLKSLDNNLKSNEAMLEAIRDEEVEAARVVEVAQQEHANVMARHAHLLKERQDIITRRHQCWEIIAAKNRHYGF